jgi:hypothetical protein
VAKEHRVALACFAHDARSGRDAICCKFGV